MNIILLGAPGSGKGTQADNLAEKYNIPAVSTGIILREAIAARTETGLKAKEYMDKGGLVPDNIVISVIKERLAKPDCAQGYILDGFPRTLPQAEYLEKSGIDIDLVIEIFVPDEKIAERMGGRRVCPGCGASYHTVWKPSPRDPVCGRCEATLKIRDDDRPEVVLSRLEIYHRDTAPLKDFYAEKNLLKTVVGQEEVADTTRLTLEVVENFRNFKSS
jgi:adenylate kinase